MEARVQDLMLSDMAAQCVLSAHNLVKFLDAQIHFQSMVAWWYNISCELPKIMYILHSRPYLQDTKQICTRAGALS